MYNVSCNKNIRQDIVMMHLFVYQTRNRVIKYRHGIDRLGGIHYRKLQNHYYFNLRLYNVYLCIILLVIADVIVGLLLFSLQIII